MEKETTVKEEHQVSPEHAEVMLRAQQESMASSCNLIVSLLEIFKESLARKEAEIRKPLVDNEKALNELTEIQTRFQDIRDLAGELVQDIQGQRLELGLVVDA